MAPAYLLGPVMYLHKGGLVRCNIDSNSNFLNSERRLSFRYLIVSGVGRVRGCLVFSLGRKAQALEVAVLDSSLASAASSLCDLGQIAKPLCVCFLFICWKSENLMRELLVKCK